MEKQTTYNRTKFPPEVIRKAVETLKAQAKPTTTDFRHMTLEVTSEDTTWHHDTEEEFFADYRRSTDRASYRYYSLDFRFDMLITMSFFSPYSQYSTVHVTAPSRQIIEAIFTVFQDNLDKARLPDPPPPPPPPPKPKPTVFIGHGQNRLWRDIKDHLHEQHGYPVEAYEIGARAGHAIRDVLEDMLDKSSFAILVMTAEDETKDGKFHARQNVVHEAGLFQGRLGFNMAIALVEEGTQEFSNIHGIQQIRFSAGNIKETFGDVLATLRREFPAASS